MRLKVELDDVERPLRSRGDLGRRLHKLAVLLGKHREATGVDVSGVG